MRWTAHHLSYDDPPQATHFQVQLPTQIVFRDELDRAARAWADCWRFGGGRVV